MIVLPEIYEGGQTIPNDISADGKVVVGYCALPSVISGQPAQAQAFRWSRKDGLVPMGFLPDKPLSFAVATNHDGSIIVGYAANPDEDIEQAWIWTAARGMEAIPSPTGVITKSGLLRDGAETEACDVTDDGVVFGRYAFATPDAGVFVAPFLWSYDNGYGNYPLDEWGNLTSSVTENPAAIAADGFSLVLDRLSSLQGDAVPDGAWIAEFGLPFGGGNWIQYSAATADAPTFKPSPRAYASRPRVIGGASTRSDGGMGLDIPAVWTSATGVVILDDGAPGAVMCVSPDGTWVGGGNYDAGTGFVWNASFGFTNLAVYLQQLDWTLGTNLYEQFEEVGLPSNVLGIAAGNKRMIGTADSSAFGHPCRGFILDLP